MKKFLYILFILVCMFSLVSCKKKNHDNQNNNINGNPPLTELNPSEIFKKVNQSVLLIFTRTINGDVYSGTGFFIDDKGTFVTNYHVIDKAESILIKTADDQFGEAIRFVSVNKEQDIAILQANIASIPVEIGDSSTIEVGDKVYTIGYPAITVMGVSSPTFTDGMISKVKQNVNGREYIQTTVSITNGNSGGPLINKYGQVIGVTTAGFNYDNIDWANLAIGINHAKNLPELPKNEENEVKYYFRKEIPYIIKFLYNGEQYDIKTAFLNNKITKPNGPIKQGYYVKAWIDAVTLKEFDFNTPIKNDYILTPLFEEETYTISFNTDGGSKIPDVSFKYKESLDLSKYVPTKEGYTFYGWDQTFTTMPYNNVTLNANWIPNTNTKYQVNYYYENELGEYDFRESKIYYGTSDEIIYVPMITGYTLQYDEVKIAGDGSTILKCFVSEIKLTINYHSNNGDKVKIEDIKISKINEYDIYKPIKEGLTFENWYEGENADRIFDITNYVNIENNLEISLYAKYKEETLWTYFTYKYNTLYEFKGGIYDISIPSYILDENITSIYSNFAYGYTSLNNVIIPSSVTSIGERTFYNCSSLTSIVIPSDVTSIGYDAFYNCSSLEKVYYHGKIENWCNIKFNNSTANPLYYAEHFYMKDNNNEWYEVTELVIPNTLTSIGSYQFYGFDNITKIIIPSSVTSIGSYAFYGCSSLTNITFEEDSQLTSIGYYAFYNCSSLTSIVIPSGVTSIGYDAFCNCSSLTSIVIPSGVTSIGDSAFYYCYSLEKVYYNGKIENWCNIKFNNSTANPLYYAEHFYMKDNNNEWYEVKEIVIPDTIISINYQFNGFTNITQVVIPNSVTSIGERAFSYCSSLTNITFEEDSQLTSIGESAFYGCSSLTNIEIPSGVTSIGKSAFSGCSSLTSIEIPSSVTSIGHSAFEHCSSLTSITIPDSVTSIGGRSFSGCSSLTSIEIPSGVTSIDSYAFYGCSSLTSIVIPSGVTSIGYHAFDCCSSLITYCEATSKPSGWDNYWNNSYRPVYWGINEMNLYEENGIHCVLNPETKEATVTIYVGNDTIITLNSTITINDQVYSITSIGERAFAGCSSLTNITFEEDSQLTSIGENAFYGCSSLTSIEIPSGVTSIDSYAFYCCSSLTSIEIPSGVTSIGSYAFTGCRSLTVYCEATSKPSGWSSEWNSSNRPVCWGYKK